MLVAIADVAIRTLEPAVPALLAVPEAEARTRILEAPVAWNSSVAAPEPETRTRSFEAAGPRMLEVPKPDTRTKALEPAVAEIGKITVPKPAVAGRVALPA